MQPVAFKLLVSEEGRKSGKVSKKTYDTLEKFQESAWKVHGPRASVAQWDTGYICIATSRGHHPSLRIVAESIHVPFAVVILIQRHCAFQRTLKGTCCDARGPMLQYSIEQMRA